MLIYRNTCIYTTRYTFFSFHTDLLYNHAQGETRTRKTVRPADFKSAVYTVPPPGQLLWTKNPPFWERGDTIYYISYCHPQYEFVSSYDMLLIGNFPCAVTKASQQRGVIRSGRVVTHLTPDRFVTTFLHFPINILKIIHSMKIVKSHLNI